MTKITIASIINAPVAKVWEYYTNPLHIIHWNNASPDWHTPQAKNDLRVGGRFVYTMAARDGSVQFDFEGVYDHITPHKLIEYSIIDGRKVMVQFALMGDNVHINIEFEAETTHTLEQQQQGWQAILDNFKLYCENN